MCPWCVISMRPSLQGGSEWSGVLRSHAYLRLPFITTMAISGFTGSPASCQCFHHLTRKIVKMPVIFITTNFSKNNQMHKKQTKHNHYIRSFENAVMLTISWQDLSPGILKDWSFKSFKATSVAKWEQHQKSLETTHHLAYRCSIYNSTFSKEKCVPISG